MTLVDKWSSLIEIDWLETIDNGVSKKTILMLFSTGKLEVDFPYNMNLVIDALYLILYIFTAYSLILSLN